MLHRVYLRYPLSVLALFSITSPLRPLIAQQTVAERRDIKDRRIRRVTEYRCDFKDGTPVKNESPWGYREYDRRGNLVVTGRFTSKGTDSPMYVREYDAENNPIKRTFHCERTDDKPKGMVCLEFRNYRLDRFGNVVEENGYNKDGTLVAKVTFLRNESGLPLEREDYFGEVSPKNKSYRYIYNSHGDVIETRITDAQGNTQLERTEYMYNKQQLIASWHVTDQHGKRIRRGQHTYDGDGNRIRTLYLNANGKPSFSRRMEYVLWE